MTDSQLVNASYSVYDKSDYLEVTTNGYLYARAKYKTSAYSRTSVLHITNIDKLSPVINDASVVMGEGNHSATITYSLADQDATNQYGKSGVAKYAFTLSSDMPTTADWIEAGEGNYSHRSDKSSSEPHAVYHYQRSLSIHYHYEQYC